MLIVQETEDDEEDDEMMMNGDSNNRDLRYDDDDLNDPVNVSISISSNLILIFFITKKNYMIIKSICFQVFTYFLFHAPPGGCK